MMKKMNDELMLYVFEVEYTDWDGSIEIDRMTAEDEDHAAYKFEMAHSVAAKISEIRCRGEACALRKSLTGLVNY